MTPLDRACRARWSLGRFLHQGRPSDTDAMTAQELACQAAEEIVDALNYIRDLSSPQMDEARRYLRCAAVQIGEYPLIVTAARAEEQLAELREMRGVPDVVQDLFDAAGRAKCEADSA